MKHFLFKITYSKRNRSGYRQGTLRLWKIVRNRPEYVGAYIFTFEDDMQAVRNAAEVHKVLPKKYFDKTESGGHNWTPGALRDAGIAEFHQL